MANPGQALCSFAGHQALTQAGVAGWAAASLGRFDIVGLDGAVDIYELVGGGFGSEFPPLQLDRLPPLLPRGSERSVPGFELRSLIGVGELGEVHRAYQPAVGREVAVRIFGSGMVGHPQFVRRFESASQRITRVEHPTVVPLLDYWREPDRAVMVSRLMTGGHLAERIPDGGFTPAEALAIFETVGAGVLRRRTGTASCTGGCGRRTSCSTTRETPMWPTSASTRSARAPSPTRPRPTTPRNGWAGSWPLRLPTCTRSASCCSSS